VPEISLPFWIKGFNLNWWQAAGVVSFLGSLPLLIIFWPQKTARIFKGEKFFLKSKQDLKKIWQKIFGQLKLTKWLHGNGHKVTAILKGFGYFGVVLGASLPYVPFVREGGIATVLALGTWQAKVLYLSASLIRYFVLAYLMG
jgi:hypothetical protein